MCVRSGGHSSLVPGLRSLRFGFVRDCPDAHPLSFRFRPCASNSSFADALSSLRRSAWTRTPRSGTAASSSSTTPTSTPSTRPSSRTTCSPAECAGTSSRAASTRVSSRSCPWARRATCAPATRAPSRSTTPCPTYDAGSTLCT